jgi:hypothetical protein
MIQKHINDSLKEEKCAIHFAWNKNMGFLLSLSFCLMISPLQKHSNSVMEAKTLF